MHQHNCINIEKLNVTCCVIIQVMLLNKQDRSTLTLAFQNQLKSRRYLSVFCISSTLLWPCHMVRGKFRIIIRSCPLMDKSPCMFVMGVSGCLDDSFQWAQHYRHRSLRCVTVTGASNKFTGLCFIIVLSHQYRFFPLLLAVEFLLHI